MPPRSISTLIALLWWQSYHANLCVTSYLTGNANRRSSRRVVSSAQRAHNLNKNNHSNPNGYQNHTNVGLFGNNNNMGVMEYHNGNSMSSNIINGFYSTTTATATSTASNSKTYDLSHNQTYNRSSGTGTTTAHYLNHDSNNNHHNSNNNMNNDKEHEDSYRNTSPPREVDNWTTLMTDGTNAALHRPGKEDMTMEEARSIVINGIASLSAEDMENIEKYWDELLVPTVSYLGSEAAAKVKQALIVAYYAHNGQVRKSGEPFIIHPIHVAMLLASLKMDKYTVMAGLLHDTVEDTDLTFDQVEALFGSVVMSIVEGETKVSKLPKLAMIDTADEQAENLRQMFVAMTDDYRIIIVKLADRLHNMRTLRYMKPEKQIKISRETLDIFAPLAHRMGIWQFKSELEDTSFMYLFPEEYKKLHKRLRLYQRTFQSALEKSQEILERTLNNDPTLREQGVKVTVSGRTKELYSLWHKMQTKGNNNLHNIADVVALRVILEKESDSTSESNTGEDRAIWLCYHVLGLVQNLPGCQPVPTRVKDYISFPKPNGYQSLHTAIMFHGSQMIEVQIRTAAMHRVAEYGMASHWAYTSSKHNPSLSYSAFGTPWLASIKDLERDDLCSRDFVECVRRELLGKRVFVFLRNGKILNLAKGATVIDAAFQIHTEVGLSMYGATINGRRVPVSYELKNGDVVNILTSSSTPEISSTKGSTDDSVPQARPAFDWMRFAKVRSTRSKLRSYFRSKQRESFRKAGVIVLSDFLKVHADLIKENSYLEGRIPDCVEDFEGIVDDNIKTQYASLDDLLIDIGKNHKRDYLRSVMSKLLKVPLSVIREADKISPVTYGNANSIYFTNKSYSDTNSDSELLSEIDFDKMDEDEGIQIVDHETDEFCTKCLPIYGDDIIGTMNTKDGSITVHRKGCSKANQILFESIPNRNSNAISMKWPDPSSTCDSSSDDDVTIPTQYPVEVTVIANDRKLLLADCSEIVSEYSDIMKTGSQTISKSNVEIVARLDFLVKVADLDQLQRLMDKLREVSNVMSVERRFGSTLI